ncbi:MAG: hypothetical protein J7M26_00540 [Armatimonadetes bacterium]|nr:hypothetical protein [Armatimonadota bacterium]
MPGKSGSAAFVSPDAWTPLAVFACAAIEPPFIERFFDEVRALRNKNPNAMEGAWWPLDDMGIHWNVHEDRFAQWLTSALSRLLPDLAAFTCWHLLNDANAPVRPRSLKNWSAEWETDRKALVASGIYQAADLRAALEQLTVKELKRLSKAWGLKVSGLKKAELIAGLLAAPMQDVLRDEVGSQVDGWPLVLNFDDRQTAYAQRILGALDTRVSLLMDYLDRWTSSVGVLSRLQKYPAHRYRVRIVPGPDDTCPYCPKEPFIGREGDTLPPYHPGCQCTVEEGVGPEP